MSNLIRVEDLYKTYVDAASDDITTRVEVLKGVDVEVRQGEVLAILGKSGVGKSTLLHLIGGLDRPTSGSVFFEDRNIHAYNDRQLDRFRNLEIGFIFQFHHLLPEFTALENIAIGEKNELIDFYYVLESSLVRLKKHWASGIGSFSKEHILKC